MATSDLTQLRRPASPRIIQNFHLVWLDENFEKKDHYRSCITELRQVVNTVNTFVDVDECVDFITSTQETAFMISSGVLGETAATAIHEMKQVSEIYIFCENKTCHEQWAKEWPKVKGVFTDIQPICEALKQAAQDCDNNAVSISFVKPTGGAGSANKDTLDCTFMYTQLLKDILLTIEFDEGHIEDFSKFSREVLAGDEKELRNVNKLQREYRLQQPIWWYTYNSFLYSMLNKALRLMEVDIIVKMGFFLRDLHNHIQELHSQQLRDHMFSKSFDVFRGQNLSKTDFDQLKENRGGLLAFNNFLSTSTERNVSMRFLSRNAGRTDMVNVLFVIRIDSSIESTPFANIKDVSCYKSEEEVLFSMHSVFRIGQMKTLVGSSEIWEVELILTSDNDPELRVLTDQLLKDTYCMYTGWHRLGKLLINLAQYDKAKELNELLLKQTNDQDEKSIIFHHLGCVNDKQGKYAEAVEYYEKAIKIQEIISPTSSALASSQNNIGLVYDHMGKYSKASECYEKALEIYKKTLPENHPDLAISYNNIGLVYEKKGEYLKALEYHRTSLEIKKKTLLENHPSLATSYNNIGMAYVKMTEYAKALDYHEKSLEIRKRTLPENHQDFAQSYNNIAIVYYNMTDYKKAFDYFQRALDIFTRSLPPDHPDIKVVKRSIEIVKKKL